MLLQQQIVIATINLFQSADLTLSLHKLAEINASPNAMLDVLQLLQTAKIALPSQSRDAPPHQPSSEHGAEISLLHLARRDAQLQLQSQFQFQHQSLLHNAIAMDILSHNVDLTLLLHKIAETKLWLLAMLDVLQLLQIAKIALPMESRDAPLHQLSLELGAVISLLHLAKRDALFQLQSQHQSLLHNVIAMDNLLHNVDLTLLLHKIAEIELWLLATMLANQLLQIAKIALPMESRDAPPHQLSLEHGAEISLLHLARRDALWRLFQHQFQFQHQSAFAQTRTATTKLHALLILAMQKPETAFMTSDTKTVTTTMLAPSTDALQPDAPTPQSSATTTMLAPTISVTPKPENAQPPLKFALLLMQPPPLHVMLKEDASSLQRTVTTTLLAPSIPSTQLPDASMQFPMQLVTTKMLAPLTLAMQRRDASTLHSTVVMETNAPLTNAWTEFANITLLVMTTMLALMTNALTMLAFIPPNLVMMETLAPPTLVMQQLDARTFQLLAMTTMQTLLTLAIATEDASSPLLLAMTRILAPMMLLSTENASSLQSLAMTTTNAPKTLATSLLDNVFMFLLLLNLLMLAPSPLVMLKRELSTPQSTVKMETNALSTIATPKRDAKRLQNSFLQTAMLKAQDAKEMHNALLCSERDVSQFQPELARLKIIMNAILKLDWSEKRLELSLMLAMMQTHAPSTDAMQPPTNASMKELFALITMFAPSTLASTENATIPKRRAVTTTIHAPSILATLLWDANSLHLIALTTMLALLIVAMQFKDASTLQKFAKTRTLALLTLATESTDVSTLQNNFAMETNVPERLATSSLERSPIFQRAVMTTTNAPPILAAQQPDALTQKSTVMITTNAPMTFATETKDANTLLWTAMTTMHAPSILAMLLTDANTLQLTAMTTTLAPRILVMQS
jgi:hypothetical protein